MDSSGHSVLQRCTNAAFADTLKRLGRYRDVFISYGHHLETSGFAKRLSRDLEREGVTTWIDSEIEQGARWRESIQDAVKLSGAVLVVLSRKWVESQYCRGEAALALNLNKPVYVIVPPLSEAQRVDSLDTLPEAMGTYRTVQHASGPVHSS